MRRIEGFVFGFRKDGWLIGLIDGLLLALGLSGALLLMVGDLTGWIVGLLLLALGLFIVWLVFPTYYQLTDETLLVRAGPLRWRIPLEAIVRVEPSRCRPCASAWSFDGLRISYRREGREVFALVAPRDRGLFLERLRKLAPRVRISGRPAAEDPD